MRHPIITAAAIAAALTMSLPAIAQVPSQTKQTHCASIAQLAESIMTARQHGMPVLDAIKVAEKSPEGPARDIAMALVQDAYAEPAFNGAEYQRKAITEFGAANYVSCMKNAPDPARP